MTSLTNQFISDGYVGHLHTGAVMLSSDEISPIYDGVGNESALSIGGSGNGAVITGPLTAGNVIYPNNSTLITLIDLLYPVGSMFFSVTNTNPGTRFTGTTWTQVGQGRVFVGVGTGTDANNNQKTFAAGNDTTGEYTHTLTNNEIPSHYHYVASSTQSTATGSGSVVTANDYVAYARNPAGAGTFEYRLDGVPNVSDVGRTSDVVRTSALSSVTTTNPSYGVYAWFRIS